MQQFTLPIILAAISAFIVILGGLIGGVNFLTIVKRFFIFSLLMGGLGFVLNFLLGKWGALETSSPSVVSENNNDDNDEDSDPDSFESKEVQEALGTIGLDNDNLKEDDLSDSDSMFDYTVSDDEEIGFTPMDSSVIENSKTKSINIGGEEIEIEPEKAAGAIRQLLSEDNENAGK